MKLKELHQLLKEQNNNTLRKPNVLASLTEQQIELKRLITLYVMNLTLFEADEEKIAEYVASRFALKQMCNLTGWGTKENPYKIETEFGSGEFYNSHYLFTNGEQPACLAKYACHKNAYWFCNCYDVNCKVVSGIGYRKTPFLHSVVEMDGKVIDFNYDLVMDAKLYYTLFNFEKMSKLDSKTIKTNHKFLKRFAQNKYTYADLNFCYENVLDNLINADWGV